MFQTLEEKLVAIALVVVCALAGEGYLAIRFIDAGKAEADAKVTAAEAKANKAADQITSTWQGRLENAEAQHAAELAMLKSVAFQPPAAGAPSSVRQPTHHPAVPQSPAAPASPSPAAGGELCSAVLSRSPKGLRADFDAARKADELAADYRLLYDAWPIDPPPPR